MSNRQNGSQRADAKREERAQRILNVAAELIQRWGYNKTTIDDIARQAGVAKGTIYLHWKTREELFRALIDREKLAMTKDVQRRITEDPEEGLTLHGFCKHSMLAVLKNPLMKAILLRDTDVLGELARAQYGTAAYMEQIQQFNAYFEVLRREGLVRVDLELREALYALSAILIGFLLAEPLMSDGLKLSDEAAADMMAETIRRTFEPPTPATPEALQAVSKAFNDYMDQYINYKLERISASS